MGTQVVHIAEIGNVTFSQNPRSKNIKVSVKSNKLVLVSYPFFVSAKEVMAFVLQNKAWIKAQQSKIHQARRVFLAGEVINTKLNTILLVKGNEYRIQEKQDRIEITLVDFDSEEAFEYMDMCITAVYRQEARILLPDRLKELAKNYGFSYNKVTIRNNRRNWGSCSSKNNISLNLQMMKLPNELIDYILLHELVHTKIKNHSSEFWKELNRVSKNRAKELAHEVKKYSTETLLKA